MFTEIYQTSLMFRMATVMLAFFVLVATALPMGYGAVGSAYAAGRAGEPPAETAAEPADGRGPMGRGPATPTRTPPRTPRKLPPHPPGPPPHPAAPRYACCPVMLAAPLCLLPRYAC